MKLQELFEISPRIASLAQRAAAGLGKAGDSLKGPIPLTRIQQEVENMRDEFNTYATQNQTYTWMEGSVRFRALPPRKEELYTADHPLFSEYISKM